MIYFLANNPFTYALGMTILHSLWQISLVALLLAGATWFFDKLNANNKYIISLLSIVTVVLGSALTFSLYYDGNLLSEASSKPGRIQSEIPILSLENIENLQLQFHENNENSSFRKSMAAISPWLVFIYLAGVLVLTLRLFFGLLSIRKFKKGPVAFIPDKLSGSFGQLRHEFRLSEKIRLICSLKAELPMVIGYLKPVVIIPAGLLMHLPFNQVEAIIAHELAHIKRNDFLINIFQSIIEIVFFYHPGIYFISNRIKLERENCCDDLAIEHCSDNILYAKALSNVEELRIQSLYPAVAFSKNDQHLLHRIKRIINPDTMKTKISERIITGVIILAGIFTAIITGAAALDHLELNKDAKANSRVVKTIVPKIQFPASGIYLTDQDSLIQVEENKVIVVKESETGEKQRFELVFQNDRLQELYIDNEKIPEEDHSKYKALVKSVLVEVQHASTEVRKARKHLEEIDNEEIEKELLIAKKEIKKIDQKELQHRIQQAQEEARRAMEEIEQLQYELQESLSEQEREEIKKDLKEVQRELDAINWDSINIKINQAMMDIPWDSIHQEIRLALDSARISLEMEINSEEFKAGMKALEGVDWYIVEKSIHDGIEAARISLDISLDSIDLDHIMLDLGKAISTTDDFLWNLEKEIERAIIITRDIDPDDINKSIEESKEEVIKEEQKLKKMEEKLEQSIDVMDEK